VRILVLSRLLQYRKPSSVALWYELKWALRRERARPATEGKASRQRFFHTGAVLGERGFKRGVTAARVLPV